MKKKAQQSCQLSLFPAREDCLHKLLESVNPDELPLPPKQLAQELIYALVEEAGKRG